MVFANEMLNFTENAKILNQQKIIDRTAPKSFKKNMTVENIVKSIKFHDNFRKPTPANCEAHETGDTVLIRPTKRHYDANLEIDFLIV